MKRLGSAFLKVLAVFAGLAGIFGVMKLLGYGSAHVIEAIQLYWNVAKENPINSAIFYLLFVVLLFVVEMITNRKSKKAE